MSTSLIAVTEGSGKNIWTDERTISSVARQAQYVLLAEPAAASYSIIASAVSTATTADHVLQIMAGASAYTRINSIRISQVGLPSATTITIELYRLTSAGTGGTSVTPQRYSAADSAAACTAMTLPTAKGSEDVKLYQWRVPMTSAQPTSAAVTWPINHDRTKPITIGTGTTNGIAFKVNTGVASSSVDIVVEVSETTWE